MWQPEPAGLKVMGWITDKLKDHTMDMLTDYISVLPIMLGVSLGVYALIGMISYRLAKIGAASVFVYGVLIVVF